MTDLDLEAARKLPSNLRFGSSTWTYPGWKGTVYKREYRDERDFKARCLEEYASLPIFRTAGIDSTFYSPPGPKLLETYASQVPENFRWVSKAWERITIPHYPEHPRYGRNAGGPNPDFLNADMFLEKVLAPSEPAHIRRHAGPFVFQFPTISQQVMDFQDFCGRLKDFLARLPRGFQYAVEIRNPKFLEKEYFDALNSCAVAHCFNHWNYMPALKTQMQKAADCGGLSAGFYVSRILTPSGVSYEAAVKMFSPYERIQRPNETMRDDVVRLARRAIEKQAEAFIIVNNRAEGNSPQTINEIIGKLTSDSGPPTSDF